MTTTVARRPTIELLGDLPGVRRAVVSATADGVVAGMALTTPGGCPESAGTWDPLVEDGTRVGAGEPILAITGSARELAIAEDHAMGVLGLAGGWAHRAVALADAAPAGLRIVCGAWKKLPVTLKPVLRAALDVAGIGHRLVDEQFVYVPKTHVALLGGVAAAVTAAAAIDHGPPAVQVTNVAEAETAIDAGGRILMVDTGRLADLVAVHTRLMDLDLRGHVTLAYAGGVAPDQLSEIAAAGADIVDIGRAILDAPLWDLHMEVEA